MKTIKARVERYIVNSMEQGGPVMHWTKIASQIPSVNKLTVKSIYFKFLKQMKEIGVNLREADFSGEKMGREEKEEFDQIMKALAFVLILIVAVVLILIK